MSTEITTPTTNQSDPRFTGPAWRAFAEASSREHDLRLALERAEDAVSALRDAAVAEVLAANSAGDIASD